MSSEPSFNNRSIQKNSKALFIKKIDVNNYKEIDNNIKSSTSGGCRGNYNGMYAMWKRE